MTDHPFDLSRRAAMATGLAALATGWDAQAASRQPVLADDASPQRLRIAFGSCARQNKPQPIWQAVRAAKPDLFVFLGDNFYADARDEATLRQRYRDFRAVESLQSFRRDTPHLAIWDDHDFGDDDEGGDYPLKALSQQLFCDEWQESADSPRRTRPGVYESYRFGPVGRRLQVILLDLRFNRTPLLADPALQQGYEAMVREARRSGKPMPGWYRPNPDPAASLLGEAQWRWLEAQLRESADVRLIGSSVQFAADGTGWEGWANFPRERQRFVELVKTTRAEGVVIASGDMHYAELSRWDVPQGYPLFDITSSGLTEVWDIPTPNRTRASEVVTQTNFGLLDIDWAGPATTLTLDIRDAAGQTRLHQVLNLDILRFPT